MKTTIFTGLLFILIIGSCTQEKNKFPQGAWQLVSWQGLSGDTIKWKFPGDYSGSNIVMFSEHHILSVGRFKKDSAVINNYVGASYTRDGNHLEETLLYSSNPDKIGQKVRQIIEFRDDTLTKTYPCDDHWELIRSGYFIEKYVRLK